MRGARAAGRAGCSPAPAVGGAAGGARRASPREPPRCRPAGLPARHRRSGRGCPRSGRRRPRHGAQGEPRAGRAWLEPGRGSPPCAAPVRPNFGRRRRLFTSERPPRDCRRAGRRRQPTPPPGRRRAALAPPPRRPPPLRSPPRRPRGAPAAAGEPAPPAPRVAPLRSSTRPPGAEPRYCTPAGAALFLCLFGFGLITQTRRAPPVVLSSESEAGRADSKAPPQRRWAAGKGTQQRPSGAPAPRQRVPSSRRSFGWPQARRAAGTGRALFLLVFCCDCHPRTSSRKTRKLCLAPRAVLCQPDFLLCSLQFLPLNELYTVLPFRPFQAIKQRLNVHSAKSSAGVVPSPGSYLLAEPNLLQGPAPGAGTGCGMEAQSCAFCLRTLCIKKR